MLRNIYSQNLGRDSEVDIATAWQTIRAQTASTMTVISTIYQAVILLMTKRFWKILLNVECL